MNRTDIEWPDFSSNPVKLELPNGKRVNFCVKVSAGCKNCYAETITRRWWPKDMTGRKAFPGYSLPIIDRGKVVLDEKELHRLLTFKPKPPFKNGRRPSVFVQDMGDLFGEWMTNEMLDRLFAVFAMRPDVDFLLLTKRPERMAEYIVGATAAWPIGEPHPDRWDVAILAVDTLKRSRAKTARRRVWPLPNVWLGTSVEDQPTADARIPHLLRCPAAVRFLSIEPLLGPVNLGRIELGTSRFEPVMGGPLDGVKSMTFTLNALRGAPKTGIPGVSWVIVGGESGPGARPCNVAWIRSIVAQCKAAGVSCFVKQLGANPTNEPYGANAGVADGEARKLGLIRDPKGGDPAEWPEELRVREWPQ